MDDVVSSADIRGFNGYINLYNYVIHNNFNPNDKYIIFMDFVIDNSVVMPFYLKLKAFVQNYPNVYLADVVCFEYIILMFKYFNLWVYPKKDYMSEKYFYYSKIRNAIKTCVECGDDWLNYSIIVAYAKSIYGNKYVDVSLEKIIAVLLSNITHLTYFFVNKTTFSMCWTCNCYMYKKGKKDCNLYEYHKSSGEKARNLWNGTVVKNIILKNGV